MTLTSVWQDRRPRTRPDSPEVAGHAEVVVVGAGLTGLTTALLLARAGRSVTVVEAWFVGAGTTGRSTAKLSLLQGTRLSMIARQHAPDVVRRYVDANQEAQAWVARFCEEHGVATQRRAAYSFGWGEEGRTAARREHDHAVAAGLANEWLDELPLGIPTAGGTRLADQLQLDPVELLDALAEQARAHGARVVEGVRVERVTGRDPVRLRTSAGELTAETVVLATGTPILDRGGFFARLEPARSYGMAFRTAEPAVDGMYLSADSPSRSLRDAPDGEGGSLLLVGGAGHTTGRGAPEAGRLEELREWTHRHFPGAVETHAWSAQDYLPHHELPVAGPLLPGQEHLQVTGGFAKWGMTNGVAAGLALSGRLLGGSMPWAEVFRPWSAHELTGLAKAGLANAEVGLEMARGWLRPLVGRASGGSGGSGDLVRWDRLGLPTASPPAPQQQPVSAVCTHLGGVVRWNDAEDSWDCPLHGSRFDADGEVLDGPATCGLRRR